MKILVQSSSASPPISSESVFHLTHQSRRKTSSPIRSKYSVAFLLQERRMKSTFINIVLQQLLTDCSYRVNRLLDDLRGVRRTSLVSPPDAGFAVAKSDDVMRERLFICFQQWINIFQRSASPEKSFVPFITQLTKQGILKAEDASSFFFRVCTETSVNHFNKCIETGEYDYAFQAVDAMSRLIVYIIKYHGDASGVNNDQAKVHYFKKILSIFVLVLSSQHEAQATFSQKPFFRFFSSLVNDLHSIESHLGPVYFQLLIVIRYG